MPEKLFFELNPDKREKIISAGLAEFAACGYAEGSTNRIVERCKISKGSLFKYFSGKEDLYFYILDQVTAEFTAQLEKEAADLSPDLFQRVMEYAALEFSWYIRNPEKARLILAAFTKSDSAIYQKTVERYGVLAQSIYDRLLEDIDTNGLRQDRKRTADFLRWFLKGFNEEFADRVSTDRGDYESIRDAYVRELAEYMELLKNGLFTRARL